jgi:hypothetical protein
MIWNAEGALPYECRCSRETAHIAAFPVVSPAYRSLRFIGHCVAAVAMQSPRNRTMGVSVASTLPRRHRSAGLPRSGLLIGNAVK